MLLVIDNKGIIMQRVFGDAKLLNSLAEVYHANGYCVEIS